MTNLSSIAALLTLAALGQSVAPAPRFDVASVKVNQDIRAPIQLQTFPGGRLTITNYVLTGLIHEAYGVKNSEIEKASNWMNEVRFDITAKADGNPSSKEMMVILQSLLVERFKLKVHRAVKEGRVYLLTVGKKGPKLDKPDSSQKAGVFMGRADTPGVYWLGSKNASAPALAAFLPSLLRCPVIDKTGLTESFGFHFEYTEDENQTSAAPSLFTAMQESLALRLEPSKGPVETLVIDSAEKPSAN